MLVSGKLEDPPDCYGVKNRLLFPEYPTHKKSIGLRSGEDGGHKSLVQNEGKCSLHHFCVFFDV